MTTTTCNICRAPIKIPPDREHVLNGTIRESMGFAFSVKVISFGFNTTGFDICTPCRLKAMAYAMACQILDPVKDKHIWESSVERLRRQITELSHLYNCLLDATGIPVNGPGGDDRHSLALQKIKGLAPPITMEEATDLAAQVWCSPRTSGKCMDVVLAEEFALVLFHRVNGIPIVSKAPSE